MIEVFDLDVALKLATERVEGLESEGHCAARRCESRRPGLRPEQVSSDGFGESDRSQAAQQKVLKGSGRQGRIGAEVFVAG